MQDPQPYRLAYNVNEAAKALSIGRNKTLELIHSGQLAHKRVGRRIIVPRSALERWLEQGGEAAK